MSNAAQPYLEHHAGMDPADVKDELRRAIRRERERLTPRARAMAAEGFAHVIGRMPQVRNARCVAAYVSRPSEPGTGPLLERLAERGIEVLLPVLGTGLQREWAWYTDAEDLQVRAPGRPPEPGGTPLPCDALSEAQVVVAPALAVDTAGGRLGQGGGWYDRVLEHVRPGALVVAMVYPGEIYDADVRPLPRQPHDRAVDAVATPSGWQWLRAERPRRDAG